MKPLIEKVQTQIGDPSIGKKVQQMEKRQPLPGGYMVLPDGIVVFQKSYQEDADLFKSYIGR